MPAAPIADRLERVARRHVERSLPHDSSGEVAALSTPDVLMLYGNWRGRFIASRPREVHLSRELKASLAGHEHESAVEAIRAEFESGVDLTPRLSRDVLVAYVPKAKRRKKGRDGARHLDVMLAHDGLHHLHLGSGTGDFVSRTRDLLFVAVRDHVAYFVGVYPHGSWGRMELLERLVRNWPDADLLHKFSGLTVVDQPSDEERWQFMQAGALQPVGIDGDVYMCPGQTTAGTPIEVTDRINSFLRELRGLREHGLRARLLQADADPDLYWFPAVHDERIGVRSPQGFVALGRLA